MIIKPNEILDISNKLHKQNKTIVLTGGCFDILHVGHIKFLEAAKKQGNILIVLLESDETIKALKGEKRPVNLLADRAVIVDDLKSVDFVVLLPPLCKDKDYSAIIRQIKPAVIATTHGDPERHHKERHAKDVGAKLVDVIDRIPDLSSSRISESL